MSAVLKAVPPVKTVEELVDAWAQSKRDEEKANRERVSIEADIIKLVGERIEGSETHELADGRKLTITAKVTRTVDEAKWRAVMAAVPEELRPITFVETAKLDLKGLHWLIENRPDVYAVVAQALEAKKAKSSITVKV